MPSNPKYFELRHRSHEAQRLYSLGQQTKVQHAELWAECQRLASTSAAGSPKAKRARVESQVEVDVDVSEFGSVLSESAIADRSLPHEDLADSDLSDVASDGLSDDDAQPDAEQETGQQHGRLFGSVFIAAADGE